MNRRLAALIPIGCAVVALFWPLFYLDRVNGQDWSLFDSLSMLVRSIVTVYGEFPLHDPWTFGGSDIAANPESRIFSPFALLDITCLPHIANVLSLTIYATFGALGMSRLLRHLGRSAGVSWAGALMFVGSGWFMLHFEVGHIAFGSLQLMPWVFLSFMRIDEPRYQVALVGDARVICGGWRHLRAHFLDACRPRSLACLGFVPLKRFAASVRLRPWLVPALVVVLLLLLSAKAVPTLMQVGVAELRAEHFTLLPGDLLRVLFDPRQRLGEPLTTTPWEMHELGCYLGWSAAAVFMYGCVRRDTRIANWRWLIFAAWFIWMGTDWLWPVNPWFVHTKIPLIRNAHVQTRLFLLAYVAWIIVVTATLERVPDVCERHS